MKVILRYFWDKFPLRKKGNGMLRQKLNKVRKGMLDWKRTGTIKTFQNDWNNSDKQNACFEHDKAIERAVMVRLSEHTELYELYSDNPSFRKWWQDMAFSWNCEGVPDGQGASENIN